MILRTKPDPSLKPFGSLLKTIILSGVLLVGGVTAVSFWTLHEDWQNTVRETQETAINLSLAQARQAEDTFIQTELSLRELQRDIAAHLDSGLNTVELSATMRDLQRRLPQLHGLFYYDAQGKWIATSAASIPAHINNSDREYFVFQRTNLRDSVHMGPVIRSRSTGDLVIPVSLRVSDSMKGFRGVLLATINVDYFRRYYTYFEMGKQDVMVLMLADSTVLYARPMPDSFIGTNLSASHLFQTLLQKNNRGGGQWTSAMDGKPRIFGFVRLDRYPLIVAAGYDTRDLFTKWRKTRIQDVAMSGALMLATVLLGGFVLRQAKRTLKYQYDLTALRDELRQANLALTRMAHADALTGLANRREFDRYLNECLDRAREQGGSVGLIMADVDHFKQFNDTHGHLAGDRCLKQLAEQLNQLPLRKSDLVARYGGEEFALILPNASDADALNIATVMVKHVSAAGIHHPHDPQQPVTLSAGCASVTPQQDGADAQTLIHQADAALYYAKQAGRNRAELQRSATDSHR